MKPDKGKEPCGGTAQDEITEAKEIILKAIGEKNYQVYKFIHPGETDHAGNRKYIGGVFKTKEEAQALADKLNKIDAERG